jgi:hypothetical protein
MQKKISGIALFLLGFSVMGIAQPGGGGFTRRTPEERAANIHKKLDSAFKLEAGNLAKLDTALTALYKAQDAKMREIFQSSGDDREAMREMMMTERKKFTDAEDEMIKAMLTEEQYKTWKEVILPAMRPQRPPGPLGGGN